MRWLALVLALCGCNRIFGISEITPGPDAGLDALTPGTWAFAAPAYQRTCAIDLSGALWCWGDNLSGELGIGTTQSEVLTPTRVKPETWSSVAQGYRHTCALRPDQSLYCWGDNSRNQVDTTTTPLLTAPSLIPGSWIFAAAGQAHTCAIQPDASLWCWGDNSYGQLGDGTNTSRQQPTRIAGAWTAVAAGLLHTCAIDSGQALWCWGYNAYGQLGTGSVTSQTSPTMIDAGPYDRIASGDYFTCALRSDHKLRCWGLDNFGQCAAGPVLTVMTPTPVDGDRSDWVDISASGATACGLRTDLSAACWGYNVYGQLGTTSILGFEATPQVLGTAASWRQVVSGYDHTCAISQDHNLWCAGNDARGQLGDQPQIGVPVQVAGTWHAPQVGPYDVCALDDSGAVSCWGTNPFGGGIGDGTALSRDVPSPVALPGSASSTSLGADSACALVGGYDWCWGTNANGGFGNGGNATTQVLAPQQVPNGPWSFVAAALESRCAIDNQGFVWCWGQNSEGEDGAGDMTPHVSPVQILGGAQNLAMGDFHGCAGTPSGIECWGSNAYGQLGDGTQTNRAFPGGVTFATGAFTVFAGGNQTCALSSTGAASCWGDNSAGQLGFGAASAPVLTPTALPATWQSLGLGERHMCGIAIDGSLWCWGDDSYGQLGDGGTTQQASPRQVGTSTSWVSVDAGYFSTCAAQTDRSLWCWGLGSYGQLGDGRAWRASFAIVPSP